MPADSATIAALYRYPVKGLSAEALRRVALAPGQCLPHDRRFAIALPSTRFDPQQPKWLAKSHFIMLMRDEALAQLQTSFDPASGTLTIERKGERVLSECLIEREGARRVAEFYGAFLGDKVARPLRVVEAAGHAFADARPKPNATTDKYVSLINLASIRALEQAIDAPVDPVRFRANVYFEGPLAWAEHDWLERHIAIGSARLRVIATITRCAATQVNPTTAERDLDITGTLQRRFGHNLMGIYAEIVSGGEIAIGDSLSLADPRPS